MTLAPRLGLGIGVSVRVEFGARASIRVVARVRLCWHSGWVLGLGLELVLGVRIGVGVRIKVGAGDRVGLGLLIIIKSLILLIIYLIICIFFPLSSLKLHPPYFTLAGPHFEAPLGRGGDL